jgi:PIN domain nuclease of toxin-antitoxin system
MSVEAADFDENSGRVAPDIYLLDTSTLLWLIMDPGRLSETARAVWQNPEKLIAVSVVSYWEIAIKANKKIFDIDDVPGWWDRRVLPFIDLEPVSVRQEHVSELSSLPDIHKDPFDRILIAQARTEDMSLVTCDALIRAYPAVRILW